MMSHRQESYRVRFDWGTQGAAVLAADVHVAVVVDVLSFTTTVSVALDAGAVVLPYRWDDGTAPGYARRHDAVLAVARSQARPGQISLSPASLRATDAPARLVLPSPNGSTISYQLGSLATVCLAASLRNAAAVAAWIDSHHLPGATTVAVIAAGERWPDGGLRPAVEDLWGAGAVIAGLAARGWTALSPEAELAGAGYQVVRGRELDALLSCASGRELVGDGYRDDVAIAAEADLSNAVPHLVEQRFIPAGE
jgi:2-phosphosulfolactate phosphatase